jgi:hypothetical protein
MCVVPPYQLRITQSSIALHPDEASDFHPGTEAMRDKPDYLSIILDCPPSFQNKKHIKTERLISFHAR